MKEKYCITIAFKVLICQLILSFVGLTIGCMWALNTENKIWSKLIYSDIKIADFDVGGKTKEEAKSILISQYIKAIAEKNLSVTVNNKTYTVGNATLIKSYDIDAVIDEAFNFGKNLSIIEKHKLVKNGSSQRYNLHFNYNYDNLKTFASNIEKETNKTPVNASIVIKSKGVIQISDDIKGYEIENETLYQYIQDKIQSDANKNIHIDAPIQSTEAEITQTKLSSINSCISSFSTSFQSSSYMRANNIDISARAINGTLLFPGETFSFNDVLGERTAERGYMEAPVIIDNKVDSGIGGGICQVSSTLYNAILKAGIQDIVRTNHSLPSTYVDLGLDATVDWENIDFKFVNTLDYPMYIDMYTEDKKLYINIFSNSNLNKKEYVIENNVNENNNVYKVNVVRKTYESGTLINSELISNDIYTLASPALNKRY